MHTDPFCPITDAREYFWNNIFGAFYNNSSTSGVAPFGFAVEDRTKPTSVSMEDAPGLNAPDDDFDVFTQPGVARKARVKRLNGIPAVTTAYTFKTYLVFAYPASRAILPLGHYQWDVNANINNITLDAPQGSSLSEGRGKFGTSVASGFVESDAAPACILPPNYHNTSQASHVLPTP